MEDLQAYATRCITKLEAGGDYENAYFDLIEAPHAIIPLLIDAFRAAPDPFVRAVLVECIWQHRRPETVEFLGEALGDPAAGVWKNALDGLVALGAEPAIRVLEAAIQRLRPDHRGDAERDRWYKQALEQIREEES